MIMKKNPDPSPPPKRSKEDQRFRGLLKKLVAVPVSEIHEQRKKYKNRKAQRGRPDR